MTVYRLRENHPTAKKVQEVFELMDKLGISFTATSHGRGLFFVVHDKDREFPDPLELVDLDSPQDGNVDTLPPVFDFKLVYGMK